MNICGFFFPWPHHTGYGMLVPQAGSEPVTSAVKTQSPNHQTTREFPEYMYLLQGLDMTKLWWLVKQSL